MASHFGKINIKAPTSVPMPRSNPLGTRRNPKGFLTAPRIQRPKNNTRVYTKDIAKQDPSQFGGLSFGQTGLTGES